MVSPFDLRGPEFLVFYLVFAACVLAVLFVLRHMGEADDPPQLTDALGAGVTWVGRNAFDYIVQVADEATLRCLLRLLGVPPC